MANRILRLLPHDVRDRLLPCGEVQPLGRGETLQEPGEPIEWVYFPLAGVVSLIAELSDGQSAEAGTAGPEGMVGLPVFLGARVSTTRNVSQTPGRAFALPADEFRRELSRHGALERLMARYVELVFISAAQSTVCARHHNVRQRCARAVLSWMDRLGSAQVRVTHEAIAEAIGARRASVSETIGVLARTGALERRRGSLRVISRECLEAEACECYAEVRAAFEREMD
jgi:CRP-like cAMP-binding protein